ncbi:penicillin acylase family protein [Herpetosiphon sp.]|uniref:Penicillin amidase n=1 Tax=Herpetosiphon aurantiacus (strain ATCC 23779 / DSM 785 / 114-95) TaxID=316274 RepID=A9B492_HERA2|nr:penicillin acylase family protein [Herpetosiphon sp.]ABX07625.1 Penicillin amidase [Herpetosiphon aurantiacus DSM 785]
MATPAKRSLRDRPPLQRWFILFLRFLLIVVLLLLLASGGGYLYLRRSLPTTAGTLTLAGLAAPVDVLRDQYGVPHIYAQSETDALMALGYVHAQDRLWQMEFQRRIARGTLSEALGETTVETDRFLRTLGVYRAAESAYVALDPAAKTIVDAYVSGINAFLAEHSGGELSPEFTLVGVEPEPWVGADVLGWAKMMSWDLGGNYSTELLTMELVAKLGSEKTKDLVPHYPSDGPLIVPNPSGGSQAEQLLALSRRVEQGLGIGGGNIAGVGSNNWVIGPSKSATGKPLLADDPHLSFRTPSIWYMAEVEGGDLHSVGATIPGLPGVIVGHNQRIAWGVTNTGPDVQDLYRETLDPTGTQAMFKGSYEPLTIISDTIRVKDKGNLPLTIRVSRHGPLISDALNANNADDPDAPQREALAFRWTALDQTDNTINAYLAINKAQNWQEFQAGLESYVAPVQNFVFADVDGNIGYMAPGHIPIRANGDGTMPADGASGDYEWTGFIPFEQLPQSYNPPQGYIATANNKVVADSYPYFLSHEWATPFRAQRITKLIEAKPTLTMDDMAAIQADVHSTYAEELLPVLLNLVQPTSDQQRQAIAMLQNWNYSTAGDQPAASIFEAWTYYLTVPMVGDELGERLLETYGQRRQLIDLAIPAMLQDPNNSWCDDVTTTSSTENCNAIVTQALDVALKDLSFRMQDKPMEQWRWGTIHLALFPHNPLDAIGPLRGFFSKAIESAGDGSTVNVGHVADGEPFDQDRGPIYRHIVDLGDFANSRMINAPGQAGHFLSPHYDDLLERWQKVEYIPMTYGRAAVSAGEVEMLQLQP